MCLALFVLLATLHPADAKINQFLDQAGTIHINNNGAEKNTRAEKSSSPDSSHGEVQIMSMETTNSVPPTPSNIFPEQKEANALDLHQDPPESSPESK
jgi:hypothetical protein